MKLYRTTEVTTDGDYRIGDRISFTLNDGEQVEALAVKQDDDGMLFCFVDSLEQQYRVNLVNDDIEYKSCELRKNLNGEILDRFPAEVREKMVAFDNGDFLRLPTRCEINGEINNSDEDENKHTHQWTLMKDYRNRVAFIGDDHNLPSWYWLQTRYALYIEPYFYCINPGGFDYVQRPSFRAGVRPVFKMKGVTI